MKKSEPLPYFSGSLFTEAERFVNETLCDVLSEFFTVFLTQEAGRIGDTATWTDGPLERSKPASLSESRG